MGLTVSRPVVIKAIVTESFKRLYIQDLEDAIKRVDAFEQQLDSQIRRAELGMAPDTDSPERLARLSEAVLLKDGGPTPVRVASVRPHGTDVLIKLAGIDSMSTAEVWRGAELAVPRAQAAVLPQGRHYVFAVGGLPAITEAGQEVGTVRD